MKKMRIEKKLVFADPIQRIVDLKVSEGFTYKQEEDGIRAVGPLYIRGKYDSGEEHKFQEVLEMDVLAPNEKLSGESFYLEVGEFEGKTDEEGINILIQLFIHGLLEEGQRKEETPSANQKPQDMETIEVTAMETKPESEAAVTEPVSEVQQKQDEDTEGDIEEETDRADIDSIEDLFEGAENVYTSYRMVVAKPNDTYASIAQRYACDESALRETNRNKDVVAKTLIILPFTGTKAAAD